MKKNILTLSLLFLTGIYAFAQTATDFTVNDCNGTSHHFFGELDAGKVVVISFVMPCGACIGPSLSAKSTVANYASSNPGRVVFYLVDDVADNPCSTLSSWASTNGMSGVTTFSNAAFTQTTYGSGGMPKIVVVGGSNHSVFFTQNGSLNTSNLTSAINSALLATGVNEQKNGNFQLNVYPNPAVDKLSVDYMLYQSTDVNMCIYNMLGAKVKSFPVEKQTAGKHETQLDFGPLSNGVYFLKLSAGEASQIIRFTIAR